MQKIVTLLTPKDPRGLISVLSSARMTSGSEDGAGYRSASSQMTVGFSNCGDDVWIARAELDAEYIAISQLCWGSQASLSCTHTHTHTHMHTHKKLANMPPASAWIAQHRSCTLSTRRAHTCKIHTWLHLYSNTRIYVNGGVLWRGNRWWNCVPAFSSLLHLIHSMPVYEALKNKVLYMFMLT